MLLSYIITDIHSKYQENVSFIRNTRFGLSLFFRYFFGDAQSPTNAAQLIGSSHMSLICTGMGHDFEFVEKHSPPYSKGLNSRLEFDSGTKFGELIDRTLLNTVTEKVHTSIGSFQRNSPINTPIQSGIRKHKKTAQYRFG